MENTETLSKILALRKKLLKWDDIANRRTLINELMELEKNLPIQDKITINAIPNVIKEEELKCQK